MDDIIIELQELIAYQQIEISRLSEELYAQQKDMSTLQRRVAELDKSVKRLDASEGSGILHADEEAPPPHY